MTGGIVATGRTRLVGNKAAKESAIVQLSHCLGNSRYQVQIFYFANVTCFNVENSIAIEKYGGSTHRIFMMIISIAIFGDRRPFALNINQIMDKDGAIAEI